MHIDMNHIVYYFVIHIYIYINILFFSFVNHNFVEFFPEKIIVSKVNASLVTFGPYLSYLSPYSKSFFFFL